MASKAANKGAALLSGGQRPEEVVKMSIAVTAAPVGAGGPARRNKGDEKS